MPAASGRLPPAAPSASPPPPRLPPRSLHHRSSLRAVSAGPRSPNSSLPASPRTRRTTRSASASAHPPLRSPFGARHGRRGLRAASRGSRGCTGFAGRRVAAAAVVAARARRPRARARACPELSMSSTRTVTSSPRLSTSSTRSMRLPRPSFEMWSRPSRPGRMFTNAPNLVTFTTLPRVLGTELGGGRVEDQLDPPLRFFDRLAVLGTDGDVPTAPSSDTDTSAPVSA